MKHIGFGVLTFVLTAAVLAGCGCTNQKMNGTTATSAPTILPTNEEVWNTQTSDATAQTTPTTTDITESTGGNGMVGGGNGMAGNGNGTAGGNAGNTTETNTATETTINHGNGPLEDSSVTSQPTGRGRIFG